MDDIIRGLKLPSTWQKRIVVMFGNLDERVQAEAERQQAEAKLKRLGHAYIDGAVEDSEYRLMKAELEAKINTVTDPGERDALDAGRQLEQALDLWAEMDTAERHEFLNVFFGGIHVDVAKKDIVGIAARPRFRAVLRACEGSVKAASAPEGADSNSVTGDPEGIRTLDLHRDRVAC